MALEQTAGRKWPLVCALACGWGNERDTAAVSSTGTLGAGLYCHAATGSNDAGEHPVITSFAVKRAVPGGWHREDLAFFAAILFASYLFHCL